MMPSNFLAQLNTRHKVFPNLARHTPFTPDEFLKVTAICEEELRIAGIQWSKIPSACIRGEVPCALFGDQSGWGFKRAWYYWVAEGPGIPPAIAERLHATHGLEVRVEGHCGCPSPLEWRKGFAIGSYHIDTQEGLNAFADMLRSIYDPAKDPDAQPYMGGKTRP